MKTVGLTFDLRTDYKFKPGDPVDANAEFDSDYIIEDISSAIEKGGFKVKKIGNIFSLLEQINNLNVDIVFNICEGLRGRNRESQVPLLLEMLDIPYVGSDSLTMGLTLDKAMAKKLFISEGISTPHFFLINSDDELIDANIEKLITINNCSFPFIVKPRFEGSSKGLTQNSRVENLKDLKQQIKYIITTYKQPALVEEFISGEEFTVAIIGNELIEIMPIVQIKLDGHLKLNDMFYSFDYLLGYDRSELICPAMIDKGVKKEISKIALQAYCAVECRDFGRIDIRVDRNDRPYVLEINPLPSLSKYDVFRVVANEIGMYHEEMIRKILNISLKRYNLI